MIKVVTFTNRPNHPGHKQLIRSMDHFGIDYHVINAEWRGFGTKITETAKYIGTLSRDYTNFVFVDGHDTFFLDKIDDSTFSTDPIWDIIVNGEKACWPDSDLAPEFEFIKSRWRYPNSGVYWSGVLAFLELVERYPIQENDDDQRWLTKVLLDGLKLGQSPYVLIDSKCLWFQSIAFMAEDEYNFNYETGRLENLITGTKPVIVHANGGGHNLDKIYKLIP